MFKRYIVNLVSYLVLGFISVDAFAAPSQMTEVQIRKIIREELAQREQELSARETAVAKREAALKHSAAQAAAEASTTSHADSVVRTSGPLSISLAGYGDMQADFYSYDQRPDVSEGSRGQSRSTLDTQRLVMELEAKHQPSDLEIEAEIEFEHGGTGSAVEAESDDLSEFESEVEKGGEVIVEELYAEKGLGSGYSAKVGRFYTALGTLSKYYLPTDYLAVRRPEVEEVMLPGQWDEIGVSLRKDFEFGAATAQVVNGLDSSGFDAAGWISGGHQQKFEKVRAQDPAFVGRIDLTSLLPKLVVGSSVYVGNTSGNRASDEIDGSGRVLIGSANYRYWSRSLKLQGAAYLGDLSDAASISDQNAHVSEDESELVAPIADGALGTWHEIGYNISPFIGVQDNHELSPFFRFDYYDTYFNTRSDLGDNGRFERRVYTAGLSYLYDDFLTLKANWSRRVFGLDAIQDQDFFGLGLGFVY